MYTKAMLTNPVSNPLRTYRVQRASREPLLKFMVDALEGQGCKIIYCSPPTTAPFVITFETRTGERIGIVAYAFRATRTPTTNRPEDERSFQIKYGSKESYADENSHELWRDPLGLYTTLFVGIDPEEGFFVAPDPAMHNPTKFFIRFEFKDHHAELIKSTGWCAWERNKLRSADSETDPAGEDDEDGGPIEVVVGGTAEHFLDLILFERAAEGLDQGNRQLLSEQRSLFSSLASGQSGSSTELQSLALHPLLGELGLSAEEVLDLITGARRLKMAVRGWAAEEHLRSALAKVQGVTECLRLDEEGGPDLRVRFMNGKPFTLECKNVLRVPNREGRPRVDFQRTRAAKSDPCSRYYRPDEFEVLAACLHARTERWEFSYIPTIDLPSHKKCPGRIASGVVVDDAWVSDPVSVFAAINARRT